VVRAIRLLHPLAEDSGRVLEILPGTAEESPRSGGLASAAVIKGKPKMETSNGDIKSVAGGSRILNGGEHQFAA